MDKKRKHAHLYTDAAFTLTFNINIVYSVLYLPLDAAQYYTLGL